MRLFLDFWLSIFFIYQRNKLQYNNFKILRITFPTYSAPLSPNKPLKRAFSTFSTINDFFSTSTVHVKCINNVLTILYCVLFLKLKYLFTKFHIRRLDFFFKVKTTISRDEFSLSFQLKMFNIINNAF